MAKASMADHAGITIDPAEAARFGVMAADWWDPRGSSAMLHRLNPVRLGYVRERLDAHFGGDATSLKPLAGKRALDVGCGAGLLSEPLARLGAAVTGIDAAPENIAAARAHAAGQALSIDYRAGEAAQLVGECYDLVLSMEVVEHVADPAGFIATLAGLLAPGGLLILSTPNRTPLSRLALITIGETVGGIPKGTHDWNKFLTPAELTALVEGAELRVIDTRGLGFSAARGFILSDDLTIDYFIAATCLPLT